jgi:eukaryotic-like serine/threonine-protein kinase
LLVLIAAAAIVAGIIGLGGSENNENGTPPATGGPVSVSGVTAYDPEGDGAEHDSEAPDATDGNASTYWTTEHYRSFTKSGVGLVLDAGRSTGLKSVTVTSDTPGFTAMILGGSAESGPFTSDSASRVVSSPTRFTLQGHTARYYVVWITDLGGNDAVHVNEVRASG